VWSCNAVTSVRPSVWLFVYPHILQWWHFRPVPPASPSSANWFKDMRDFRSPASLKRPASASLSPLSSLRYHFSAFRFHKSYYHPIPYNSQRLSIDSSKLCKARQLWPPLSPSPACPVCLRTTSPSLSHSSIQSFPSNMSFSPWKPVDIF